MYERALEEILRDRTVVDHDDEDNNEATVSLQLVRETVNRCGESERRRALWKQIAVHMLKDMVPRERGKDQKKRQGTRVRQIRRFHREGC